ncbi:unnamed protein product [Absidia cylindrospora]
MQILDDSDTPADADADITTNSNTLRVTTVSSASLIPNPSTDTNSSTRPNELVKQHLCSIFSGTGSYRTILVQDEILGQKEIIAGLWNSILKNTRYLTI